MRRVVLVASPNTNSRPPRRRFALLLALVCAALPADGRDDSSDPTVACIEVGLTPPPLERLVTDALRVLEQAGHDPGAYVLDLRLEDLHHPDFRDIEAQLVPSVVFLPRDETVLHPLRVHPRSPCNVSWLWRPEAFTPWQREVVEQARLALIEIVPRAEVLERADVELLESADELALSIRTFDDLDHLVSREEIRLTIRKSDLAVRDAEIRSMKGPRR